MIDLGQLSLCELVWGLRGVKKSEKSLSTSPTVGGGLVRKQLSFQPSSAGTRRKFDFQPLEHPDWFGVFWRFQLPTLRTFFCL